MKIGMYGGSFNPPHLGHRAVAVTVAEQLRPDLTLVIPSRCPPHKELAEDSPAPEERLRLCGMTFAGVARTELCDIELRRDGASYTADTVEQLRARYPKDELYLVVGTDMLLCFEHWYRFRYLIEQCVLTAVAREDEDMECLTDKANRLRADFGARVLVLHHDPLPVSSSQLLQLLPARLGSGQLDPDAYREIIRRRLYGAQPELSWLREQVYPLLKPERIAHVSGCESEAVRLAALWGEDPELAAEAAILHDATKRWSLQEQIRACGSYGVPLGREELDSPAILHAITGASFAREEFGVCDAVYGAIRWHTTGRADMTLLEKIVYLADTVEPNRDFPGVEQIRRACGTDLDEAMSLALRRSLEHVEERGKKPHPATAEAARWYEERKP